MMLPRVRVRARVRVEVKVKVRGGDIFPHSDPQYINTQHKTNVRSRVRVISGLY